MITAKSKIKEKLLGAESELLIVEQQLSAAEAEFLEKNEAVYAARVRRDTLRHKITALKEVEGEL